MKCKVCYKTGSLRRSMDCSKCAMKPATPSKVKEELKKWITSDLKSN